MRHQFFTSLCLMVFISTTYALDDERERAIESLESQGVPSIMRTSLLPDLTPIVREKLLTKKALPIIQQSQIQYFQQLHDTHMLDNRSMELWKANIKHDVQDSWNNHQTVRMELKEQLQNHKPITQEYYIQRLKNNLESARGIIPSDILNSNNLKLLTVIATMDFSTEDPTEVLAGKLLRFSMTLFHNPDLLTDPQISNENYKGRIKLYFRNTGILYLLSARAYRLAMHKTHNLTEQLAHGLSVLQIYSYAQACIKHYTQPAQKHVTQMIQAFLEQFMPQLLVYQAIPIAGGTPNNNAQTYGEKAQQILEKIDWS